MSGEEHARATSSQLGARVLASRHLPSLPEELCEEVLGAYRPEILAFFRRHGLSAEQAEDRTQEVLVKVLRGLPSFRGQAALKTWVYQIAANVFRDLLRRRRRSSEVTWSDAFADSQDPQRGQEPAAADPGDDPETAAERRQLQAAVQEVVARLPDQQRVAMTLQLAGYPPREIAAVMGKSATSVRMLLSRARSALKQPLAQIAEAHGGARWTS
jgi:RNA polymerase sigma-70 factor (ECF subfamily)